MKAQLRLPKQNSIDLWDWVFTVLALLCGFLLPWWGVGVAAFLRGALYLERSVKRIVVGSAICTGLVWVIVAFYQDIGAGFRVSKRLAGLLTLPGSMGVWVYLILFLLAGILGALSALFGARLRELVDMHLSRGQ